MPHSKVQPIIFTDLDGSLLNHDTYSAEPADELIRSLHDQSLAHVIPITSKTQSELALLDHQLPLKQSIKVSENGAIIKAPSGSPLADATSPKTVVLGANYHDILQALNALPTDLRKHIKGFADMSDAQVSQHTGLSLEQAQKARERQASEPFLWSGSAEQLELHRERMAADGILLQRGGRFHHLTGNATKRKAMYTIMQAFQAHEPKGRFASIAIGDGPNDLEMIEAADFGVIIPNPAGAMISSNKASVRSARKAGPAGWVLAVEEILQELGMH